MTREERLQIAQEMLAQAKMKQNPEYYFNTLAASDRPAMTRPVASSAPPPAMQQMPAAQQMAQMQAAGVRPVGMADGGIVRRGFLGGGFANKMADELEPIEYNPDSEFPENPYRNKSFREMAGDAFLSLFPPIPDVLPATRSDPNIKNLPTLNSDLTQEEREKAIFTPGKTSSYLEGLGSLSNEEYAKFDAKVKAEDARKVKEEENRGKGLQPGLSAPYPAASNVSSPESVPKKVEDTDRKLTALESIKAEREAQKNQNFNMALMQAGLAMMGGKSPNALQNIAEGGISGLAAYTGLEKSDRASALDERKLAAYEDSLERKAEYQTSQTTRAMYIAKQRGEIEAQKAYSKWAEGEGASFSPEEKTAYLKSLQDRYTNIIFQETMAGASSNPLDLEVE
jgi:hypothetical protein